VEKSRLASGFRLTTTLRNELTSPRPSSTFKPTRTSSLPVADGRMTSVVIPTVSKLRGWDQFESPTRKRDRLRRSSVGYENMKGSLGFRFDDSDESSSSPATLLAVPKSDLVLRANGRPVLLIKVYGA
jgi:hypothetical protein